MKKLKHFLHFSFLILLLELLAVITLATRTAWSQTLHPFVKVSFVLIVFWFCGSLYLLLKKGKLGKFLSKALTVCTCIAAASLLLFSAACVLVATHPYDGSFSMTSTLFDNKNVMVVVPHQDDDINLLGGLIEQYTAAGSEVSVVFSTNGDKYGQSELRSTEAVHVLTSLGVKRENIHYLGFGDQWQPQMIGDQEIQHIYNSPDPDLLWTSLHGATETYGTTNISCHLDVPYTRSNYVSSFQSVISEVMPDTIFAVDFDSHIDHRATDLLFEEALCNVLTLYPDYHPAVYKGFCYGTAWTADNDYFSDINLQSSKKPDDSTWSASAFGYTWEDRTRFPMSSENLNWILSSNSVFDSLDQYASQDAWRQAERILNGDKVFWERRTDSLLYGAEIFIGSEKTDLLNDFKLKDFAAIDGEPWPNAAVAPLHNQTVSVELEDTVTVNSIYLYDSTDLNANILEGYITFSDGSRVDFGTLNEDGSATKLVFPERQTDWMEIVVTQQTGENCGLSEVEAFYDQPDMSAATDSYLMAVDSGDNFVYDHMLRHSDTLDLQICRFPIRTPVGETDVTVAFDAVQGEATYRWEGDTLIVSCTNGSRCIATVSDGYSSTTFSVSNPTVLTHNYLQTLRFVEKTVLNLKLLYNNVTEFLIVFIDAHF